MSSKIGHLPDSPSVVLFSPIHAQPRVNGSQSPTRGVIIMAVLSEESEAMLQHVKEAKAILLDTTSDVSSQDVAIKELSQVVYDSMCLCTKFQSLWMLTTCISLHESAPHISNLMPVLCCTYAVSTLDFSIPFRGYTTRCCQQSERLCSRRLECCV